MTATITDLTQWRRTHVFRHCDAIRMAEFLANQSLIWWSECGAPPALVRMAEANLRWGAAYLRDQMRYWWKV